MEDAPNVSVMASQVADIRKWRDDFSAFITRRLETLETRIDDIVTGRPTWTVTIVITLLSSICVGLAVKQFG